MPKYAVVPPTHTYTTSSNSSPEDSLLMLQPLLCQEGAGNKPGQPACQDGGIGSGGILPGRKFGRKGRSPKSWGRRFRFGYRGKFRIAAQNPSQQEKAFPLNKTTGMNIGSLSCLRSGWVRLTPGVFVKKVLRSDSFSI